MKVQEINHGVVFNAKSDICRAQEASDFDGVLHIFDANWHGIRSATSCLPGKKLAISHKNTPSGDGYRHIIGIIFKFGIHSICYQGFSEVAAEVAEVIYQNFGTDVAQYVITHVATSQFEHHFEMHMLKKMIEQKNKGIFRKLGSVKPDFAKAIPDFHPKTIINIPPKSNLNHNLNIRSPENILVPLENTWRKNLYTNILAALYEPQVKRIYTVNQPTHLELIADPRKITVIGFQTPAALLQHMASCGLVLNVTLVECQPMTQIEANAVGTPCLTGPLAIKKLSEHPLAQICEIPFLDNSYLIRERISQIMHIWQQEPTELTDMIEDYNRLRLDLGLESYREFLEL